MKINIRQRMNQNIIHLYLKDSEKVNADKSIFIQCRYDPDVLSKIKQLPIRYWNMETKLWEIPVEEKEALIASLEGHEIEEIEEKYDRDIPANYRFKIEPLPHQLDAIRYGLNHPAFINGDQQGLGKTYESLILADIRGQKDGFRHTLILCGVGKLQHNWKIEAEKFTDRKACIIGDFFDHRKSKRLTQARINDLSHIDELPFFLIINIEALSNQEVADLLSDACVEKGNIGMVIYDEFHKCKSVSSSSGKNLLRLNTRYKLGLSGTPMPKNPLDLYLPFRWFGLEQRNWWQFRMYHEIRKTIRLKEKDEDGNPIERSIPIGFQHLDELKRKLDHFMIRRLKDDVLNLPEKLFETEYLEMEKEQQKVYDHIYDYLAENIEDIKKVNPLTHFAKLRMAAADASLVDPNVHKSIKLDRMEEIVEETIANGQKILIFTYHHALALKALERLKKYKPASILSETKDVEEQKRRFEGECDVIVGTIGVMGTGHTLISGSVALFLEQPWNYGDLEQAQDRIHRIGQKTNVTYITLLCKDSVDERVNEINQMKYDISDRMVDRKKTFLVDYLLKR